MKKIEANGTTYYYVKAKNEENEAVELLFLSEEVDRAYNRMGRLEHYIDVSKQIDGAQKSRR